jgi:acetoin utilization deacetylase AcuC-like enzyme
MTIAIISHPSCALHETGEGHPESPDRVKVVQKALEHFPFKKPVKFYQAPVVSREVLELAHDKQYVAWIHSIAPTDSLIGVDADTMMGPHSLEAALHAAGAVTQAVDLVLQGKAQAAFCNVRPPGHHAEHDKAMGFCFFNNVAVGVLYALEKYAIKRVAIIDFDLHHGNGTQHIFQHDPRVLYCSSFEHPFYPGYEPGLDNAHILGVPLAAGAGSDVFRERVRATWFDKVVDFKPELVFFSAGFDAHANDPLGDLQLTAPDYVWITEQIIKLTAASAGGRAISVLEGGYNLTALAECVPLHVEAF